MYENSRGEKPVDSFIKSLDTQAQVLVVEAIRRLEKHGNALPRPHAGFLEDGIFELRIRVKKRHIRLLYFFFKDRIIVLTSGFIKKSKKVPKEEIKRAKSRRTDYLKTNKY